MVDGTTVSACFAAVSLQTNKLHRAQNLQYFRIQFFKRVASELHNAYTYGNMNINSNRRGSTVQCIDVPSLSLMKVYGYANKVIVALDLRCNPIAILNLGQAYALGGLYLKKDYRKEILEILYILKAIYETHFPFLQQKY